MQAEGRQCQWQSKMRGDRGNQRNAGIVMKATMKMDAGENSGLGVLQRKFSL
jgi:hypothetical protein